ncbi:MAG: endonuclease MutS2 [Myxococcota bacterium]
MAGRSFDDLEWGRLVEAVTARCVGPAGRRTEIPVASTVEGARTALEETREAWRLLEEGEPLPLDGIREVRGHLERLRKQGVLEASALRDVGATLAAARALRRFLGRRKGRAPVLHRACTLDPALDDLERAIADVIGPDGGIVDGATPELRNLRTEVSNLRGRIVARLETMLHKHADILQDRYYTVREGRYVLPVRTDAHERLPGIVHATSASGATAFVEPRALVAQGNRLKMAHGEMEREEQRILGALSERVGEHVASIDAAADALDRADLRSAAAKLGRELGCSMLELVDEPRASLRRARHPGLLLSGVDVVPNDLELEGGRALVISGPNAGGKTVALKVLGLAAWIVRAGLPFPCEEGSTCGFFEPILTDVGDDQSITRNLSTFSAHVTNLSAILAEARPGALVLLDELAGSTDPQEGAALACATVLRLCDLGAATAVTTHYEQLKALAEQEPRLANASVGLDVERMEPTFRLNLGVPGSSSALVVAARFGMPEPVLARARELLPDQSRGLEELVTRLHERMAELESERAQLAGEREQARRKGEEAERRLERLRARARDELDQEVEQLRTEVRQARGQVEAMRKRLRRERADEAALRQAERELDAATRRVAEGERAAAPAPAEVAAEPVPGPEHLAPGDRVWVPRLRAEAEVVEVPHKGRVRVAAGPMKLWVDVEGLRRTNGANGGAGEPPRAPAAPAPEAAASGTPTRDNTLDVRGLRVDDALSVTETFLDRLYGEAQPVGYILHGIGTGALRDAIRGRLGEMGAPVERARPGREEEGGDRVTVVHLR